VSTFVLATFNRDKGRELAALLAAPGRTLRFLYEFPGAIAAEEHGDTLLANARLKAEAAVRHTGLPAIADDTGLEVDALDGAPGHLAARFAGADATYADNVALLLERLRGVPPERRTARFRTVCVARFPDGHEQVGEGVLEGRITDAPRGDQGFGYDPVFEVTRSGFTLAELDEAEKNRLSHRALAARGLNDRLARLGGEKPIARPEGPI
jgi:XTP/dITP diphosphohydrolase